MKQSIRRQAVIRKAEAFIPEQIDFTSPEAIRSIFEDEKRSSEYRFDHLASSDAVLAFNQATRGFQSRRGIKVTVTKRAEEIPDIHYDTAFKYSHYGNYGSLHQCSNRIKNGENLTVLFAWEEDLLIGYGIVASKNGGCEMEILDVDNYSQRSAGLVETLLFQDLSFQIGVGHVVVSAVMVECPRPIHVDATNSSSRYIFKSLGFLPDDKISNPCILRLE